MSSHYELPANASEDILRLKIDEVKGKLLSLSMSNCIVAQPEGLLSLLPRLQHLRRVWSVKSFERVCLLSKTELQTSNAERTVEVMAGQLPSILYVHIYCVDSETARDTTVTWMRLREGHAGTHSRRGKVMLGKPCIMCSTQTFIALVKPCRRDLQTVLRSTSLCVIARPAAQ
ncbi:hypothetical protein HPB51_004177 [Rhipicephalus microplus]|uniref:Uncharacterized protein n=1 Tax=Rhipicephalus microplus TaxID=6941 RepID=A0A9J6D3Y0_RHIMP|nr:hypothetical protein HPB51_004177 [Rhipicephalus microplus]